MKNRIQSIDIFRGLTMLLMVWVNDFWSLSDIPSWLEHMPWDADALGFSDVIFPAFLFIVGLSIPFARRSRIGKGEKKEWIAAHIFIRSAALLLMGVLMVNLENYHEESALMPRPLWQLLMVAALFLIWNRYPRAEEWKRRKSALRTIGWAIIVVLLFTFRSDPENGYNWIEPHWWGILGLIGWSYFIGATLQLFLAERVWALAACWLFFSVFNILVFAERLEFLEPLKSYVWIVGDGSLPALTIAGCLVSSLYLKAFETRPSLSFCFLVAGFGLLCLIAGLILRPYWGISKIQATPAWTQICSGLSALTFAAVYYVADILKWTRWADFLRPAGVATLTCYLLPYLAYPILELIGIRLPSVLSIGMLGLASSMAFALLMVFATGCLIRFKIQLRL